MKENKMLENETPIVEEDEKNLNLEESLIKHMEKAGIKVEKREGFGMNFLFIGD